jgi:hypothetical protein
MTSIADIGGSKVLYLVIAERSDNAFGIHVLRETAEEHAKALNSHSRERWAVWRAQCRRLESSDNG